jgi:hypothetical protein
LTYLSKRGFFPVIIVFVGAENMFSLVDAVVKTSIALPVKERIAEGLSRAGASNTLKVVSYNTILGLIASAAPGAIRQFCALAVVVLVAHWFLVHTFFIAVLSIDIQRLEVCNVNEYPIVWLTHKRSSTSYCVRMQHVHHLHLPSRKNLPSALSNPSYVLV